jgi:hypothetical protein
MGIWMRNAIVFGSVLSFGCSKDDNKAAETAGAFLSLADFPTATATKLTSAQAVEQLSKSSFLKDDAQKSEDDGDDDDSPMSKCMSENEPKLTVINKSTLSFQGEVDATACIKEAAADSPIPFSKYVMRYAVNLTCENADFSEYGGKKVSEVDLDAASDAKCAAASSKVFSNLSVELGLGDRSLFLKQAVMTKDGGACESVKADGKDTLANCIFAEYTNFGSLFSESEVNEVTILEAKNLVDSGVSGSEWFESGQFDVTVNNFTGSVSYKGVSTAPEYSLTDGTETKTGTVAAAFAPSLLSNDQGIATRQIIKSLTNKLHSLR